MTARTRPRSILRLAGRLAAGAALILLVLLVGFQFARAIGENLAMAHELSAVNDDVAALQKKREQQLRELRRLEDPDGVVPEIHDRLRMTAPDETIIFVSPQPAATP